MENYDLDESEVVLYKGEVVLPKEKGDTQLLLTNINFVLITKRKKLFQKEEVFVEIYPITEIKYYDGSPQIIRKGNLIEMYFLNDETEFTFESKGEARKFVTASLNLLAKKNTFTRVFENSVDAVKDTIKVVDDKLGINSVEIAKNVVKNGIVKKTTNVIGSGVKAIGYFTKKNNNDKTE